jgi:DNA-3-methyladenine glycosylase II
VSFSLSTDDYDRARRVLMRRDARLRELIRRAGRCPLADNQSRDRFALLLRALVSQQLSMKAASTIHGRVLELVGGLEGLSPGAVLALDPQRLRQAGLSRQKISYLRDLSEKVSAGALVLDALDHLPDEEVIAAITQVKGFGRWSAEMFLIFRLNRPDVFPVGDLGIVKGMQKLYGLKRRPAPRTLVRLAESWRPYRSVAAWYLWRLLD